MTLTRRDILAMPDGPMRRSLIAQMDAAPPPKRRTARGAGGSSLEKQFRARWSTTGHPQPVEQHRFHGTRRWRLDFAWPAQRVAVEVHGGIWSSGRHTRGAGFAADRQKMNAAAAMGWQVFELTTEDFEPEAWGRAVEMVAAAINQRRPTNH